ncbi:MAG: helix-turn-helix domain-containing protein [Candidatus Gracilibacteria bacterium]
MTIYINIGELMKKKGFTAVKLAELSGLTPEHISVIKSGKTKRIEFDTIDKLLNTLEVEPNELFKYKKE